jgi:hypothetical protein
MIARCSKFQLSQSIKSNCKTKGERDACVSKQIYLIDQLLAIRYKAYLCRLLLCTPMTRRDMKGFEYALLPKCQHRH